MLTAILEQADKLFSQVWAPLNQEGDRQGVKFNAGSVTTAHGFAQAYQHYAQSGWGGLYFDPEFGGQGLPFSFAMPVTEMAQAANMALGLCPMLTAGAIETVYAYGSEEQKQVYLHNLIAGTWTGTMNLTEPQAGTDLGLLTTSATPNGDHYLIKGQKIYITWGEHDMTDNIIHLVLARLPDAPAGVKGISLFLVPKLLVDAEGNPTQANDLRAINVEHKLGIHASPTCVMSYGDQGGAVGYLVGEPNQGLKAMFTMMNNERLMVGLQGVGLADAAYQHALAYAKERVQSKAPGHTNSSKIIFHPDVRRMLMTMRSLTEAGRALCYMTARDIDLVAHGADSAIHQPRVDLFIPIVKAWVTEIAQEVTSLGIQIHGGMGFVEETGAAQFYRDARILPIYEGTNGVQALDLVGRKILMDQGQALTSLLHEIDADIATHGGLLTELQSTHLAQTMALAETIKTLLLSQAASEINLAGAVSFDYLMLLGYLAGGWQMMRAMALTEACEDKDFAVAKRVTCAYYLEHLLPRAIAHGHAAKAGDGSIMALAVDQF